MRLFGVQHASSEAVVPPYSSKLRLWTWQLAAAFPLPEHRRPTLDTTIPANNREQHRAEVSAGSPFPILPAQLLLPLL